MTSATTLPSGSWNTTLAVGSTAPSLALVSTVTVTAVWLASTEPPASLPGPASLPPFEDVTLPQPPDSAASAPKVASQDTADGLTGPDPDLIVLTPCNALPMFAVTENGPARRTCRHRPPERGHRQPPLRHASIARPHSGSSSSGPCWKSCQAASQAPAPHSRIVTPN